MTAYYNDGTAARDQYRMEAFSCSPLRSTWVWRCQGGTAQKSVRYELRHYWLGTNRGAKKNAPAEVMYLSGLNRGAISPATSRRADVTVRTDCY
jgi:hypothetical protein